MPYKDQISEISLTCAHIYELLSNISIMEPSVCRTTRYASLCIKEHNQIRKTRLGINSYYLKGLLTDFAWGGDHGTVLSEGIRFTLSDLHFYNPFMVSRTGPITPLLLLVDHFGPISDTFKSPVSATWI